MAFLLIGHKAVLSQGAGAEGVTQEVEAFLIVDITVRPLAPQLHRWKMHGSSLGDAVSQSVRSSIANRCVDRPAGWGSPHRTMYNYPS